MANKPRNKSIPTRTIERYRTDAKTVTSYQSTRTVIPPSDSTVGGIPSSKSLRNLIFTLNNSDVPMVTMITVTFQRDVSKALTVQEHKQLIQKCLRRLRTMQAPQYVWVREFTGSNIPHWHIFTSLEVSADEVDEQRSRSWSEWFAKRCSEALEEEQFSRETRAMAFGDGRDFLGCVRVERLRSEAAGFYAGKEGGKRFQKIAPPKWNRSGSWWDKSRGIVCTPIERIQVYESSLKSAKIKINGESVNVPFKFQFGRGLKTEQPAVVKPPEPFAEFLDHDPGRDDRQ